MTIAVAETPLQKQFYPNLEALRGLAAMAVVFHHAPITGWLANSPLAKDGWLFVDFFFVLSGFVIALVHLRSATGSVPARAFLIRRFFRLYPLHLATILMVGLMYAVRIATNPATVVTLGINDRFALLTVANLFMVQAWGFHGFGILNVPSWSISTEWLAYLFTALICLKIASPTQRIWAMAVTGAVSLAVLASFNNATLDGDFTWRAARCLYSFALGTLIWRLMDCEKSMPFPVLAQLLAIAGMVTLVGQTGQDTHLSLLFPLCAALLVWGAASDKGSPLRRLLTTAPAQWLGRHSYSIYMIHLPLFMGVAFIVKQFGVDARLSIFSIIMILIAASLSYRWIEVPWRERGRAIASRATGGSAPPKPAPPLPHG